MVKETMTKLELDKFSNDVLKILVDLELSPKLQQRVLGVAYRKAHKTIQKPVEAS
jgi:hypothetical protein